MGETDLAALLASLAPRVRPGRFTLVPLPDPPSLGEGIEALIREEEATTAVVAVSTARARGWPIAFQAAWITLGAQSDPAAVGLTAAISQALAAEGIACNVLAAFHHDHLLVPADRLPDALRCLRHLSARHARSRLAAPTDPPGQSPEPPGPAATAPPGEGSRDEGGANRGVT